MLRYEEKNTIEWRAMGAGHLRWGGGESFLCSRKQKSTCKGPQGKSKYMFRESEGGQCSRSKVNRDSVQK